MLSRLWRSSGFGKRRRAREVVFSVFVPPNGIPNPPVGALRSKPFSTVFRAKLRALARASVSVSSQTNDTLASSYEACRLPEVTDAR